MKKLALLVFAVAAYGQFGDPRWRVRKVGPAADRPANCSANRDVFVCSGSGCSPNPSLEFCTATDTYTAFSGGVGTVTSVDATGGVETASGSAITGSGTVRGAIAVNAQTGTTYTVLTGDRGKLVTHTNGSAIAVTLPQAGGSFPANWYYMAQNRGAGTVTITPTTSTIDGAASLALLTNQGTIIVSDGTNYFTQRGLGAATGLGDPGSNGIVYRNGAGTSTTATATEMGGPLYCADAGSNDTYTCTLSPAPSAYTTGAAYRFKANTANTGAATINFNALGAKTIKKVAGGITTDLSDNDIRSGQVVDLNYDGTNMQMQSTLGNAGGGGGGGLVLVQQQTASASATLDFASCISSTYDAYEVHLVGLIPATNAVVMQMRVSTDGGSSYLSTNIYSHGGIRSNAGGAVAFGTDSTSQFNLGTSQGNQSDNGGFSGVVRLYAPGDGARFKHIKTDLMEAVSSATGYSTLSGSGIVQNATAIDAFRFFFSSGNITSGVIRCYGLQK